MSDEYSLHTKFLLGQITAAEYERRMARLVYSEKAQSPAGSHPFYDSDPPKRAASQGQDESLAR